MELTLNNIKSLKKNATPLEKRALKYIINKWSNYKDKNKIFTDVIYRGCRSGIVRFLIWYKDTTKFYTKYKNEINILLYEFMKSTGLFGIHLLFGGNWDKKDPLANENFNQNTLAWFGFEETVRNISKQFEQLQNCINKEITK